MHQKIQTHEKNRTKSSTFVEKNRGNRINSHRKVTNLPRTKRADVRGAIGARAVPAGRRTHGVAVRQRLAVRKDREA